MDRTIGSLLKAHRSSTGLTQEELAEKAEVSARTVSDVERGLRARIYRDTALRLADALDLGGGERVEFQVASRGRRSEPARPASPLPMPPTRLIGREREVEIVLGALGHPEIRLVTLTGPGGIGKTRLALEAAARARTRDGAAFVQLGTMSDPAEVVREIARAVGVSGGRAPTIDAIADHLAGHDILLVLDTFEHVLDAASDVAHLLSVAPGVTILATSREALRVRGEHEVAIPTLELPPRATTDAVLASPATALFVERAVQVRPSLSIDEATAATIADICRRLNGLPLAIELAAARIRHLPLESLRDQLEHALDVLVAGPRDLPPRQRTMRDTIAWSYALLDGSERRSFLDLSVFSGGWTLEAASAVCGTDVLGAISALIDKSLVVRVDDEEPRWEMLDVIHEFGAEQREGAEAEDRHCAHFLSLAEEAEPELGRTGQHDWLRRLAREHDNIRTALRYAIGKGDAESALRIAGAIWRFWLLHGDLSEGRGWLRASLELDPSAAPHARAKATWGLAWLAYHQGDYAVAETCADELLSAAEPDGDPVETRNALTIRGIVDLAFGRFAEAIPPLERCVELLRDAGPSWLLATSLLNLGQATTHAGDARAGSILEESRQVYLDLGDQHFAARSTLYVGYAALLRGDAAGALASFRESLISFWELEDTWGVVEALESLAATAAHRDGGTRAIRIAGAADALRETISTRPFPADHAVLERSLDALRLSIEDVAWRSSWERGRAMTFDEAVDEALQVR
jgi:predicted ATPase/transcriptional regulator with XRE-family HTH domain